jgi:2-iminobutanoate/2-iminopropanoate deaminase
MSFIPISPARTCGNLLFLSGQLGFLPSGGLADGIEAQTEHAVAAITRILGDHGASLSHVVRTGVWLVHGSDFTAFNAVYARLFENPYPARSTVVSQLLVPGALVEIEAVACLP